MARTKLRIDLRKPPALNNLYGISRHGKKYLTDWGRVWKEECILMIKSLGLEPLVGEVSLLVHLYTNKRQDNDGILKILMDSIEGSDIIPNDYWIFDLRVIKHRCGKESEHIEVFMEEIDVKS